MTETEDRILKLRNDYILMRKRVEFANEYNFPSIKIPKDDKMKLIEELFEILGVNLEEKIK